MIEFLSRLISGFKDLPSILLIPVKARLVDYLDTVIMTDYLRLPEKILLIFFYIFRLVFQVFNVLRLAMPPYTRRSVQKLEHSQAFDVRFLSLQLNHSS